MTVLVLPDAQYLVLRDKPIQYLLMFGIILLTEANVPLSDNWAKTPPVFLQAVSASNQDLFVVERVYKVT